MSYHSKTRPVFLAMTLLVVFSLMLGACAPATPSTPAEGPGETVAGTIRGYTYEGTKFPNGTTVTYMAGMSPEQQAQLQADAVEFKALTNIDLRIEIGDDAKFNALVAAGNPPDLYYCSTPGIQAADGTFALRFTSRASPALTANSMASSSVPGIPSSWSTSS